MLVKKFFRVLNESAIRRLSGGPRHNCYYFIAVHELESNFFSHVIYAKLRNQMGSQKSPGFPCGYEPFLIPYWKENRFCISRRTIEVPRVKLSLWSGSSSLFLDSNRYPACILNPEKNTDQYILLKRMADRFELETEIRVFAAKSLDKLEVVTDLLVQVVTALTITGPQNNAGSRISSNTAERLEAYLPCAPDSVLRDLVQLLRMPEPGGRPSMPVAA